MESRQSKVQIMYEQRSGYRVEKIDLNENRKMYDNIHRFVSFPKKVWCFIDTPHFQRLRKIKQLGCLQYVFPGATHTRFEHSIGTAHLAKTFLEILMKNNPSLYEEKEKESALLTITLAGLLHDLGHGPYSHTFDSYIVTKIDKKGEKNPIKWTHELASEQLFLDLVYKEGLKEHLSEDEIDRIRNLINGQAIGKRKWEFQLISNKTNGIDVDKLDYFRRDAFYLGAQNIFVDHELLMNEARIIDDQICYPTKYLQTVHNIFHCRYKLYKNYYFNLVSKGIQLMICDILSEIKAKFNFKKICQDIFEDSSEYIKLTDNILDKVEDIHDYIQKYPNCPDAVYKDHFQRAVDILHRIKTRKIYKFVREFHYFLEQSTDKRILEIFEEELNENKILEEISNMTCIDKKWLCLSISDISFGMKGTNPLKKVGFFRKQLKGEKLKKIMPEEIQSLSMLYTHVYLERSIKIFVKNEDPDTLFRVEKAFSAYCKGINLICQKKLQKKGLNVVFEGRGGTTPMIIFEQNPISMEKESINPFESTQGGID